MKRKSNSFSFTTSEKENLQGLNSNKRLSFSNNLIELEELYPEVNLNIPEVSCFSKHKKKLATFASTILGTGVGLAMMPIFNEEVESLETYGIDVHSNSTFFTISTINTLIVAGISTYFYFYNYLVNYKKEESLDINKVQEIALTLCKVSCFLGSLIQVSMLWNIELNDQEIEGTHGFDQFIAWATVTSLPLIIFKTLSNFENLHNYITSESDNVELNNLGSKIAVYGISSISLIGRGISLTNIFNELQKQIDIDETVSLPLSIIFGGIVGNITLGLAEYSNLKKLFTHTDEVNCKKLILGLSSLLEGGWFALPIVSQGLDATKDWNALLKGVIFTPLFLSHMNSESSHLYHSILPETQILEDQNNEILIVGDNLIDSEI